MPQQIPEMTFSRTSFDELIEKLTSTLLDFEVTNITYTNEHAILLRFQSSAHLQSHFSSLCPTKRNDLTIDFRYRRTENSTKKTSAAFYFTNSSDTSKVQVFGGTKAIQNIEKIRLLKVLSHFKRAFSNKIILSLFLLALPIAAFILNFFFFPETINSSTAVRTFLAALVGFPFAVFAFYRPYIFHNYHYIDLLRVFPSFFKVAVAIVIWFGIFWGIVKSPTWLGRDSMLAANNPEIQKSILRDALTPQFLANMSQLASSIKAYDESTNDETKEVITKIISTQIYDAISIDVGLGKYPINNLPLFLSSATSIKKGNWFGDTALLMMEAKHRNGEIDVRYLPHIDSNLEQIKYLTLKKWLNEPVIKDNFGKVWTRYTLVKSVIDEKNNNITPQTKSDLERLRNFNPSDTQFVSITGKISSPKNTIERETLRAIAEELIRSLESIKNTLSATPSEVTSDN